VVGCCECGDEPSGSEIPGHSYSTNLETRKVQFLLSYVITKM
jgi:hypothetical protein